MNTKEPSADGAPKEVKYYCRHCGLPTHSRYWSVYSNFKCPKCTASTQPKEWD
jgi:Zn finger protein HypA/HybF involved in hydrogenase expression